MQKIRIVEKGFQHITGYIGDVEFYDGVSVGAVSKAQADRIAASMRVESVNEEGEADGAPVGPAANIVANVGNSAPVVAPLKRGDDSGAEANDAESDMGPSIVDGIDQSLIETTIAGQDDATDTEESEEAPEVLVDTSKSPNGEVYSQEQLAEVADKAGINGLREIGKVWGVKSTSINGLIQGILKAQADAGAVTVAKE